MTPDSFTPQSTLPRAPNSWWRRVLTLRHVDSAALRSLLERNPGLHAPELIPAEIAGTLRIRQKILGLIMVGAVSVAAVGGAVALITIAYAQKIQEVARLDFTLQETERELLTLQSVRRESRVWEDKVRLIRSFLTGRAAWSHLLTLLEERVPATVVYQNLVADAAGAVTLQGRATDIASVDYLQTLLGDTVGVTDVRVSQVTEGQDHDENNLGLPVRFELHFKVTHDLLYPAL